MLGPMAYVDNTPNPTAARWQGWVRRVFWPTFAAALVFVLGWLAVTKTSFYFSDARADVTCPALISTDNRLPGVGSLTTSQWRAFNDQVDDDSRKDSTAKLVLTQLGEQKLREGCNQANQERQTWIILLSTAGLAALVLGKRR